MGNGKVKGRRAGRDGGAGRGNGFRPATPENPFEAERGTLAAELVRLTGVIPKDVGFVPTMDREPPKPSDFSPFMARRHEIEEMMENFSIMRNGSTLAGWSSPDSNARDDHDMLMMAMIESMAEKPSEAEVREATGRYSKSCEVWYARDVEALRLDVETARSLAAIFGGDDMSFGMVGEAMGVILGNTGNAGGVGEGKGKGVWDTQGQSREMVDDDFQDFYFGRPKVSVKGLKMALARDGRPERVAGIMLVDEMTHNALSVKVEGMLLALMDDTISKAVKGGGDFDDRGAFVGAARFCKRDELWSYLDSRVFLSEHEWHEEGVDRWLGNVSAMARAGIPDMAMDGALADKMMAILDGGGKTVDGSVAAAGMIAIECGDADLARYCRGRGLEMTSVAIDGNNGIDHVPFIVRLNLTKTFPDDVSGIAELVSGRDLARLLGPRMSCDLFCHVFNVSRENEKEVGWEYFMDMFKSLYDDESTRERLRVVASRIGGDAGMALSSMVDAMAISEAGGVVRDGAADGGRRAKTRI